jgi:hypothetical protein
MAWDSPDQYFDDFDDFDEDGDDISKCCNRCGAADLHWEETHSGWRLFNELGEPHDCQLEQASEGFHIVEEE